MLHDQPQITTKSSPDEDNQMRKESSYERCLKWTWKSSPPKLLKLLRTGKHSDSIVQKIQAHTNSDKLIRLRNSFLPRSLAMTRPSNALDIFAQWKNFRQDMHLFMHIFRVCRTFELQDLGSKLSGYLLARSFHSQKELGTFEFIQRHVTTKTTKNNRLLSKLCMKRVSLCETQNMASF